MNNKKKGGKKSGQKRVERPTLDVVLRFIFGLQMGIGMAVAALLIKIVSVLPFVSKSRKEISKRN